MLVANALTTSSRTVRLLWWVLCVTPPVSLLLSLGETSADSGASFFVAPLFLAAFGLAPVVIIRALISDRLHGERRALVIGLALSVVPMFVLSAAASWWVGWPERRMDLLYVFGPLVAGWVVLAVLAREQLRA